MTSDFPYKNFKDTDLWNVVNQAIEDLIDNNDIKETTAREYIVGYICKSITNSGLVTVK